MHVNIARITNASQQQQIHESPEIAAEAQRDYVQKMKEQEQLAQEFERELEHRTIVYRKQQEAETERIRKELEKQHLRDVEFRQNLADLAVEQQKKQVDLETRYAKRELDRQRRMARDALERTKLSENIQVEIDSGAGNTVSGASTVAETEKVTADRR
uniref:CAHS 7a n=1 Tax=Macrobiotus pallarii TaxID=576299 RepID=A0AAE9W6R6_9BILA|nr:CAHS 7a [Macrobiotus pallari]